jgi:glyoxylase-like metal-dependent hydrolase (beta-lactamase superfamily II)
VERLVSEREPEAIDTRHLGLERVICCWRVGDVLVDPGPELALPHWLDALTADGWRPRALLLTHIHLDHAGASGALVRRWPDLEVWVHERGAPHVIDPSKLLASAGRLYGGDEGMARLWGAVLPVPEERVHALSGGETLTVGDERFRVAYTPGHASHHVCYLHEGSGRAFVGDTGGVRIPPADLTIAPTPPPDVDVEAWDASLDAIAAWRPASLGLTHFGAIDEVDAQLDAVRASLHELAALARDAGADAVTAAVRERAAAAGDEVVRKAFAAAVPPEHIHQGLERYWRKRAEREADGQPA